MRKKQLTLTKAQEKEIYEAYASAGSQLLEKMNTRRGPATKALLNSYGEKLYNDCNSIIQKYAIEGAQTPATLLSLSNIAKGAGLDTLTFGSLDQIVGNTGKNMLQRFIAGDIYKDGVGLSTRIWSSAQNATNDLREVMAACLAQNMGATEMAKVLQTYVNPSARVKWDRQKIKSILGDGYAAWNKNLEYNSLRLARTTLSHSFTMGVKEAANQNPFLKDCIWHSAHAIGRTCEECAAREGKVYPIKDVPFDHPNGLCWLTYVTPDLEEMATELKDWINGGDNPTLDSWYESTTGVSPFSSKNLQTSAKQKEELTEYARTTLKDAKSNIGITKKSDWEDFLTTIGNTGDEDYVKVFSNTLKNVRKCTHKGNAYYNERTRSINISFGSCANSAKAYDLDSVYATMFHETAHMIDHLYNFPSAKTEFQTAMKADIKLIVDKITSNKQAFREVIEDNNSLGIQDFVSALKHMPEGKDIKDVKVYWTHEDEYWNTGNVYKQASSELWANISMGYASSGTTRMAAYMEEYFPNSCKVFKDCIKTYAKSIE